MRRQFNLWKEMCIRDSQTTFNSRDMIATIKQMVDDTITSSWAEIINRASEEDCVAAFEAARDNCNAMGLEELTDYYENSYKANVETVSYTHLDVYKRQSLFCRIA